jgi:hypothetical protein
MAQPPESEIGKSKMETRPNPSAQPSGAPRAQEGQRPAPGTWWQDLCRAEASANQQSSIVNPQSPWLSWAWIELADEDGNRRLFYAEKAYDAAVHKSYATGCQHERLYQAELQAKARERTALQSSLRASERRWLDRGAFLFFGILGGLLMAALLHALSS